MTSPTLPVPYFSAPGAALPVAIDYLSALALRQLAVRYDDLPKYLLAPEISALLHYVPDLHRRMLLATLWNTAARINEALALTRDDYILTPPYPFVQLATLKQRSEKAARGPGRVAAGVTPHRLVPLSDAQYVNQLEVMVATLRIPLERRNKGTGKWRRQGSGQSPTELYGPGLMKLSPQRLSTGSSSRYRLHPTRSGTVTPCICSTRVFL